jgi:hypothetical protein
LVPGAPEGPAPATVRDFPTRGNQADGGIHVPAEVIAVWLAASKKDPVAYSGS